MSKKQVKVKWYEIHEVSIDVVVDEGTTEEDIIKAAMQGADVVTETFASEYYGSIEENWQNGPLMNPSVMESNRE